MTSRTIWKITICRVGTGCQIVEYDAILKRAWRKLVHNDLNKPYVTGVNPRGERFGPDLTLAFENLFAATKADIWRVPTVKYAERNTDKIRIIIQRFDDNEH